MNATNLAMAAYSTSGAHTQNDRATELDAFMRVTRRLKQTDPKKNYGEFVRALHDNRQLWLLLAVDVADNDNGLVEDLRARIFYLAEFTRHHTSRILAGEETAAALVDINTAIMAGLRPQGGVS